MLPIAIATSHKESPHKETSVRIPEASLINTCAACVYLGNEETVFLRIKLPLQAISSPQECGLQWH
jgi:hypothetical protein